MKSKTFISVSKLAWFADNPDEYRAYGGGTMNEAKAAYGEKKHAEVLKKGRGRLWNWVFISLSCLLGVLLVIVLRG